MLPTPDAHFAENELAAKKMPSWRLPVRRSCSSAMSATAEPNATLACTVPSPCTTRMANSTGTSRSLSFCGNMSNKRSSTGTICNEAQQVVPNITAKRLPK